MLVFRYDYGMTLVKFDKKNITDCYRCGAMYGEATGKTALQKKPQSLTPLTQTHLHTQQLVITMPKYFSLKFTFTEIYILAHQIDVNRHEIDVNCHEFDSNSRQIDVNDHQIDVN